MAKGTGMEIAEFFTRLGFKVDDKEIKKYERSLENLKKTAREYKKITDSIKNNTQAKAQMDTVKYQQQLAKYKKLELDIESKLERAADRKAKKAEMQAKKMARSGGKVTGNNRGVNPTSGTVIGLMQDLRSMSGKVREKKIAEGITSELPFHKQLNNLQKEYGKLVKQFHSGKISARAFNAEVHKWKGNARTAIKINREFIRTLSLQDRLFNKLKVSLMQYGSGMVGAFAAAALMQDVFQKGKEVEGMEAAMLGAAGSADLAADRISFLRKESERIGVNFLGIGRAFSQLAFAAKGKLNEEQLRELFTGVSQFGTTMKVDAEQMKRGFMAIQQMLNKNQIMAEELKQQLGEQLPGSIRIFADALGITEQELFDRMEKGLLKPAEVLPLVAKEFKRASEAGGAFTKASMSVASQQNRFYNAYADIVKRIKESELWIALANGFGFLANTLQILAPVVEFLSQVIGTFLNVLMQLLAPLMTIMRALFYSIDILNQATDGWLGIAAGIGLAVHVLSKFVNTLNLLKSHPIMLALMAGIAGADFISSKFTDDGKGFLSKASSYMNDQSNPYTNVNQTNHIYGTDGAGIANAVADANASLR